MKHTTFDISFYCRDSKVNRQGLAPIEMSIVINGERCLITLPRKEKPSDFKRDRYSRKDNDIKQYLQAVRNKVGAIQTEMMERDIPLTAPLLRDYFRTGGIQQYSIENLFDEYYAILRKRIGVNLTAKTYRKYELAKERFFELVDKRKPLSFLTNGLMKDYMATLNQDFDYVTAQSYCQKIKTVCLFAVASGRMTTNPFFDMHLRKGEKNVQFLSEEEVAIIRDSNLQNASLRRVRDLFIFQINSGLAYCDMAILVPEDYQVTDNGLYYIHKQRRKTNSFFTAVVFPDGVEVLKRYDFVLPILSNQKYNVFLKRIAELCGIETPLHTHVARHTYATMCLNHGVRIEVVARLLGHRSSSKVTFHYAKFVRNTIISEVNEAFNLAIELGE
jgi:site-specific recombinase XerD